MRSKLTVIISTVLIFALLFSLAGCGGRAKSETGTESTSGETVTGDAGNQGNESNLDNESNSGDESSPRDTGKGDMDTFPEVTDEKGKEAEPGNRDENGKGTGGTKKGTDSEKQGTVPQSGDKLPGSTPKVEYKSVPILTYHSIGYEEGNSVRLPEGKFREQMQWLKDNGYTTISLDDLYSHFTQGTPLPEKPVILTFDDGYADNYEKAFPILKEFGFTATIYIITNTIDKSQGYLTAEQIREMAAYGITMGSHTCGHEELDKLSYEAQLENIRKSRETLENILGKEVRHFAYPIGLYNENTLKALREAGFKTAVTMNRGWAQKSNGLLTLSRVFVSSTFGMETFRERLTNPDYPVVFS